MEKRAGERSSDEQKKRIRAEERNSYPFNCQKQSVSMECDAKVKLQGKTLMEVLELEGLRDHRPREAVVSIENAGVELWNSG